jgi:hypothetical protein
MALDASDFVDVTDPSPADLAAEGELLTDAVLAAAATPEAKEATAERYGSSNPGPVRDSTHAQALQDLTGARAALAEAESFELPVDTPPHRDYLTAQPERPGNAEDRHATRLRLAALNEPAELGGLGGYATADAAGPHGQLGGDAGVVLTDAELDAYAEAGIDPVAEAAQRILERRSLDAVQAINVARMEAQHQDGLAQAQAQRRAAYDRQAQQAVDAARARGADESWIRFHLDLGTLPGHPGPWRG